MDFFLERYEDLAFATPPTPEQVQARIQLILANHKIDVEAEISYNGVATKLKDLPSELRRAEFGYGHFCADRRQCHPYPYPAHECIDCVVPESGVDKEAWMPHPDHIHSWPYTPTTCLVASNGLNWLWLNGGQNLVCPGCGIEGT